MNIENRYTFVAKALHWLMAALIVLMVSYGWAMDDKSGLVLSEALVYHLFGGILFFALAILRLTWRIIHAPPELPEDMSHSHKRVAKGGSVVFYVLFFVVPISGLMTAVAHEIPIFLLGEQSIQEWLSLIGNGRFELKRYIHAQAMYTLLALIILHICAALIHQFWFKDGVVRRMFS